MYILYQKYCNQPSDNIFILIIEDLKWIILRDLKFVDYEERDDFKQALYMKIHEVLLKSPIKENDDYKFEWKTHEEEMLRQNKYLTKMINEYGMSYKSIIQISDCFARKEFENIYKTFVGDMKLFQYFSKVIKTFRINFIKAYEKDPIYHAFRLNKQNENHQEYISTIQDNTDYNSITLDLSILNREELDFLDAYFKTTNQTDLSKELNITQQAVSKRYKKIIKKLKGKI